MKRNRSIQKKIMILCFSILIGMIIFCFFAIHMIKESYDQKIYEKSLIELRYFSNVVQSEMDAVETLTFEIAMDKEFQTQLYNLSIAMDKQLMWNAMSSFRNRMSVESVKDHTITAIIYDNQKDYKYEINNTSVEIPDNLYQKILKKTQKGNGAYVYINPTEEFPYVISGRQIRERLHSSLEDLGTLIVAYDVRGIVDSNIDTLDGIDNNLCILADQTMVYTNNQSLFSVIPKMKGNSGYEICNVKGKKYCCCYLTMQGTGWTFINMSNYERIYQTIIFTERIVTISGIVLFLIMALIATKIGKVIIHPLHNLADSMRIVEKGDFEQAKEILLPAQLNDEVGILSEEFRIMLDKIVYLIHENYEKQITLMDTKYRALQAQINPHFINNTLNSIGWMIKAERNDEAQKMVIVLGRQLRAAFREDQLATIEEEIDLLQQYIYIQKIRYEERVTFQIEAQEDVMYVKIPRLSLQPIVENSIRYGVESMDRMCTICIQITKQDNMVEILISDDGMGMSEERLIEVKSFQTEQKQKGIGLRNIKQRLDLLYKDQYQLKITSDYGKGTQVKIIIPYQ